MHDTPPTTPSTPPGFYFRLVVYLSLAFVVGMTVGFQRDASISQPETTQAAVSAPAANLVVTDIIFSRDWQGAQLFTQSDPLTNGEQVFISVKIENRGTVPGIQYTYLTLDGRGYSEGPMLNSIAPGVTGYHFLGGFVPPVGTYTFTARLRGSPTVFTKSLAVPRVFTQARKYYLPSVQRVNGAGLGTVITTSDFDFNGKSQFTVETWFNPDDISVGLPSGKSASRDFILMGKRGSYSIFDNTFPKFVDIKLRSFIFPSAGENRASLEGKAYVEAGVGKFVGTRSNQLISYGGWNHLVYTFDSAKSPGELDIYLNGKNVKYALLNKCLVLSPPCQANDRLNSPIKTTEVEYIAPDFLGSLYRFRLYDVVLSASEITQHYNTEKKYLP